MTEDEQKKKPPKPHEPRLLVPGARRRGADATGYTDIPALAMRDEPEALSREDYERHVLGRAVSVAEQLAVLEAARLERARLSLTCDEQIDAAVQEARRRHMDVSSDVRLLNFFRVAGKQQRHIEARLGALWRRVFRDLEETP